MARQDPMTEKKTTLADYIRSAYPAVAIESHEEERLLLYVAEINERFGLKKKIVSVSATKKLRSLVTGQPIETEMSFGKSFDWAADNEDTILVVFDCQSTLQNPGIYRSLKENFARLKMQGSCVLLVAPMWTLPAELEHDVPIMDFPLPTRQQLESALNCFIADGHTAEITAEVRAECLDAASGLTLQEAENAFALSISKVRRFDSGLISDEKMKLVKSSGLLELSPYPEFEPGGLDELKRYITEEVIPSFDDPLLAARGIITLGLPGVGKSLMAKAIAAKMKLPLLRADISSLKGSLVGQSEQNMRKVLKLVDAVSPCILWLDEIDKGVGGHASSAQTDGGTTLGMVGILLTWLQEHTSRVFVIATANSAELLPAPLTRPGRFDERFYVGLPSEHERVEIAMVHLKRFQSGTVDPELAACTAKLTPKWTGAEIEQLIKSAARRTQRQITKSSLETASKDIHPMAIAKSDEVKKMEELAKVSFRPANTPVMNEDKPSRKLREA